MRAENEGKREHRVNVFKTLLVALQRLPDTVKYVIIGHSKIDTTMVLKTNGSLMKVEIIAECSLGAFCNTFDLH